MESFEDIKESIVNIAESKESTEIKHASELDHLQHVKQKNRYIEAATSENTRRSYRSDIRHFERWGGLLPASPETILQYLYHHAELLNSRTLERRLIAVRNWHQYQNFPDPTDNHLIKKTLKGIKNTRGKPKEKAPALTLEQLELMVAHLKQQETLMACRNSALIQVGFFGAFRRSELTAIRYEHIKEVSEGFEIVIPRSKTDQSGEGLICALPYGNDKVCPVRALKSWLEISNIKEGPIFRRINKNGRIDIRATSTNALLTPRTVNLILKTLAKECYIVNWEDFSAHSLRRGLATTASRQGASIQSVMRQGRWKHYGTVLGYIEEGQRFQENAAGIILRSDK